MAPAIACSAKFVSLALMASCRSAKTATIAGAVECLDQGHLPQARHFVVAGIAFKGGKFDGIHFGRRKGWALIYAGKVENGFGVADR
jgi:hypothetical protein